MNKKRFFMAMGAALACVLVFAGCAEKGQNAQASGAVSASGERGKLFIYNWTYYTPDSVIQKFEKEYNCDVTYDQFASNEEMYTKLKSGGAGYDIVFPSCDYVSIMIAQNMFEPLNHSKLPNLKNIDPAVLEKANYDPTMKYAVPYYWGAAGVTVNTEKVPTFDKSWSIFGRTDLKDRMTMLDDMREVMGDALVYLGFSVNSKDPTQIAAAEQLIDRQWKPNLVKFDAESFGKGFASGDFWVVQGYAEVVFTEIAFNKDLMAHTQFFIPKEGGPAYIDSMCILKGAKHLDMAYKFINFIQRPNIYAEFCDTFGFPASVNVPARALKKGPAYYSVGDLKRCELKEDVGEALELYNDAWLNKIRVDG